jgi:hypothetical protein
MSNADTDYACNLSVMSFSLASVLTDRSVLAVCLVFLVSPPCHTLTVCGVCLDTVVQVYAGSAFNGPCLSVHHMNLSYQTNPQV